MGLKSMHAEKQSEQPQQSVQDNSLIEQQSQRITELEHQISELSSINSTLMSELRKKSEIIVKLNEKEEIYNKSDLIKKQNAELEKRNRELEQSEQNARQEAMTEVSAVKEECAKRERIAESKAQEADRLKSHLKAVEADLSGQIDKKALNLIESKLNALHGVYEAKQRSLDRKFKAKTASYDSCMLGLLLYGVLTTVFTAVRSEAFVSDFKAFFIAIWQFLVNAFQLLLKGGQWASKLGDMIPQPVVATIVHYLLLIVFVGGIGIGVGVLIFLGAIKVFEFYTDDYVDTLSLAVFMVSLAVSVYFAEPIRAVIPINLLLLLILVHIVYVLIRWYVKGCKRSRGYY